AAGTFSRRKSGQLDGDPELRIVMRTGSFDLPVDRGGQTFALSPFLQHRLGTAQRPPKFAHSLGPVSLDELGRRLIAAVEKHRSDHRFADIAEYRLAQPCARAGPDRAKLDVVDQPERLGDVGAALLAH